MFIINLIKDVQNKTIKIYKTILAFFTLIFIISLPSYATTPIKIAVFNDHYDVINNYNSKQLCPNLQSADLRNNQMLTEFFIFCNALKVMQYSVPFELVPYPVSTRALQAIQKGEVITSGFGVWHQELTSHKLTSSLALLNKSEFTKGLYTTKELSQKLSQNEQFKPSELIVGLNQNWQLDWKELKCGGFNVLHINQYKQIIKMVKLKRIDLLPFVFGPSEDLHQTIFDITIYPVKGIKIPIQDSLHFAINTNSEQGKKLYTVLELGLKKLRQQKLIKTVYQQLGIINPALDSWQTIGC